MTTATGVQIVPATREHIPLVAWVVLTASRSHMPLSHWDLTFGNDEDRLLRYLEAFADTKQTHWGSWQQFMVAEVNGEPAAALCGFFENDQPVEVMIAGAMEANLKLGISPQEWAEGWERAKSIANIGAPHEPGAWIVEHVATKPEFRRRGLVERLIHEMLDRGRERGAKTAEIGVLIGNGSAQRAYEKCGFEVVNEARDADFEAAYGCPGAYYLRRSLLD